MRLWLYNCAKRGYLVAIKNEPPEMFYNMSHDMTKPTKWVCAQRRLRSAWASAQSDQSLRCALSGLLRTPCFFMRTAKPLIRLVGCPGWSESSLGARSLCWFCHVAAQLYAYNYSAKRMHYIITHMPRSFPGIVSQQCLQCICQVSYDLVDFSHQKQDKTIL